MSEHAERTENSLRPSAVDGAGPLLRVDGLGAGYGDVQVLWGVDVEVRPGERVALIGPNGAGKTTLLKTLSGLIGQIAGRTWLAGQDVTTLPADARVRAGISQVPEGRLLFAGMTVRENLLMGAYTQRDNGATEVAYQQVLGYFPELRSKQRQLAGTMSGGEQQMCAVGRALMAQPRVLLIDEMSAGLAPIIVERLVEIVRRVNEEQGVAVFLVEQDVQVALEMTERGYVIENGRIVAQGASRDLMEDDDIKKAYLGI